jgi:hypothetical protein
MKLIIEVDTELRQVSPGSIDNRFFSRLMHQNVSALLKEKFDLKVGDDCGWQDGQYISGKCLLDAKGNKVGRISL